MGDGFSVILGILIGGLILVTVGLSLMVFVTGGLSRRSVCFAMMVILLAAYSIIGFVYTNTPVISMYSVMASDIVVPLFGFFVFASTLALKRMPRKQFFLIFGLALLPVLIYWANWTWWPNVSLSTDAVYLDPETGAKISVTNPFFMIWVYILLLTYCAMAVYTYTSVIKENRQEHLKKRLKLARIGLIVGFIGALSMEAFVGIIPYAHSIGHVLLFPLVLFSYKAYMSDYSD